MNREGLAQDRPRRVTATTGPLSLLFACLIASGLAGSDAGVRADDSAEPIRIDGPGPTNRVLPPARVLRVDPRGWVEFMRPAPDRFKVVSVITGVGCRADGSPCAALAGGDFEAAIDGFRQQAAAGRDDVRVLAGLGNAQRLKGDLSGAARTFAWALADHPDDADLRLGLAGLLCDMGAGGQAEAEVRSLLDAPDLGGAALVVLGDIQRQAGHLDAAVRAYKLAREREPDLVAATFNRGVSLLDLDRHAEAADAFRAAGQRLRSLSEAYLYEGLAALRAEQPIRAAVALHRARDLDGDSPALDLALGLADQELGLDAEAASCLERVLRADATDERVHQLLAVSLVRIGQLKRAADVLEAAFRLGERDADDHFQLGLKLFLCEQAERAIAHFAKAMVAGKRDADVFYALGQALFQTGQDAAARKALLVASHMRPDSAAIHLSLGLVLQRTGDGAGAVREMEAALRLAPTDVETQERLLEARLAMGEFKACAELGRRMVDSHPDAVSIRFDVAFCLALDGQLQLASERMEEALDHDLDGEAVLPLWRRLASLAEGRSGGPGVYLLLGLIHERRGNVRQAIELYENLIRSAEDGAGANRALARIHALRSPHSPPAAR